MSTLDVARETLVARTVPLSDRRDPLEVARAHADGQLAPHGDGFVWLRDGVGFVTGGVAARVPVRDVDATLRTIEVHDLVREPGTGAIAVGSLPFRAAAGETMVVPAWVQGRAADGSGWRTEIGRPRGSSTLPLAPPGEPSPAPVPATASVGPGVTRRTDLTTPADWRAAVGSALDAIDAGELQKVVLARTIRIDAGRSIDPIWLLECLAAREPDRFLYAHRGLAGASPELLVRRAGARITSRPLAGSVASPDRPGALAGLERSAKDRREHELVVASIARRIAEVCATVDIEPTVAVGLRDVGHLATTIVATARRDTPSALALALLLHPTPAVGGSPRSAAMAHIADWEPAGRGRYAGPVGWVDASGDGEFAVALRCAEIDAADETSALVRAGAGIVAGSDPDAEWTEIDAKLTPVLRAFTEA